MGGFLRRREPSSFSGNTSQESEKKKQNACQFADEVYKVAKDQKCFLLISIMAFWEALGYDVTNHTRQEAERWQESHFEM